MPQHDYDDLIFRLRKRAEIRRQIPSRKSVQNGEPDRIADLLEETADAMDNLLTQKAALHKMLKRAGKDLDGWVAASGDQITLDLIFQIDKLLKETDNDQEAAQAL